MKKENTWLNLLWWTVLYFFWIMVFQKRAFAFSRTATVEFCYLIFIMANYYFHVLYTFPRFLYRKKYFAFVFFLAGGIAITALLRVPLAAYLNQHYFIPGQAQPGNMELFKQSVLNITIWVVFILAVKMGMDRFRFQQRLDEMEEQKKQAELDFLNAQFNPHFLFNSIHSIYGHIDKQNTTARNMLLTFSEMLRYQLYDCNSHTVNIEKETGYLKNYVALQKARKEENVAVELHVAEEVKGFLIAPLLFVPFIENSFKYVGNSEETENKVRVSLQKTADILWFNCYNTREPGFVSTIAHKGIGMANVKRRLSLLYPGKHELEINDGPGFYEVNLKIQLA